MICSLALITTNSLICSDPVFLSVDDFCFIPLYSVQNTAVHRIQWDKAELIHREENRITTDVIRVGSEHNSRQPSQWLHMAPSITREKQLK
jgi:hypothetical protein